MNVKNKELFEKFQEEHLEDGGIMPFATALTNLVHKSLVDRDYKIYGSSGYDINGVEIKEYDVVLWTNLVKDPFFMVCLEKDGNVCDLYRCNPECKIEKKVC